MMFMRLCPYKRPAAWIALLAILFQALLPLVHHPALFVAGNARPATILNLCMAPVVPGEQHRKHPAHLPTCPICQTIASQSGFVPEGVAIVLRSLVFAACPSLAGNAHDAGNSPVRLPPARGPPAPT